jgi:hypothetical protein
MCKNASANVGELLNAIEPTVEGLLSVEGLTNTPEGQTIITEFKTAITAAENWQPGDDIAVATEALNAFNDGFQALPIPEDAKVLEGVIEGGVVIVLGIFEAHPATTATTATEDTAAPATAHIVDAHANVVAVTAATSAKVATLVPGFKPSIFHSPQSQYNSEWNKAVKKSGPKYAHLKVA